MGTIALFITVFILLCIFALIFVCYRAGRDSRQQEYDEEAAGATQRATIVLSILPHSAAAAAVAGQPYNSSTRPRSQRKSPTPPTIIRNLPVVIWDKPKAVSSAHASAHEKDASSVKDAAGKEAGNQDASHASTDSSEEGQERLCVICCCEYEAGESIKLLPCLHMYHQGCIDAWLGRSHVCPVCQADVVRAAGLSAEVGDWSIHTMEAVNVISGVQHHSQTSLMGLHGQQQEQHQQPPAGTQQQEQQEHADAAPHQQLQQPNATSQQHQETAGSNAHAGALFLPVSNPPVSAGAAAAVAAAAPAPAEDGPRTSSSGHSSDAIALVVPRAAAVAEGTCRSGLGFRV